MANRIKQPAFIPCVKAPTISMRKVTNFAALIPPSRQMNYVLPDFSTLESHPAGTYTSPTMTQQVPITMSSRRASAVIGGPGTPGPTGPSNGASGNASTLCGGISNPSQWE